MQITDILAQTGGLRSISNELGISETEAATGASALLPLILGGFKKQAQADTSGPEGLEGMLGRLGTHGASLTLAGRNLKTWTDYTGWDPETNAGAQRTLVRGFSFAATPIPRSVALTFSTSF